MDTSTTISLDDASGRGRQLPPAAPRGAFRPVPAALGAPRVLEIEWPDAAGGSTRLCAVSHGDGDATESLGQLLDGVCAEGRRAAPARAPTGVDAGRVSPLAGVTAAELDALVMLLGR